MERWIEDLDKKKKKKKKKEMEDQSAKNGGIRVLENGGVDQE